MFRFETLAEWVKMMPIAALAAIGVFLLLTLLRFSLGADRPRGSELARNTIGAAQITTLWFVVWLAI